MDLDFNNPEVKAAIATQAEEQAKSIVEAQLKEKLQAAIDAEVGGLKDKNSNLIKEKKQLQEQLQKFEGMDVEKVQKLIKQFENDEEAKLIADGKIDEVISLRTERMRSSYDGQVNTLTEQLANLTSERDQLAQRYDGFAIEVEIRKAAERAEVLPEAIEDILRRSAGVFKLEDGKLISRDQNGKIKISSSGNGPYTPEDFLEELKESASYYWPTSKGLGAGGGHMSGDAGDMAARLQKAAESGDMKLYRHLREEQKKHIAQ